MANMLHGLTHSKGQRSLCIIPISHLSYFHSCGPSLLNSPTHCPVLPKGMHSTWSRKKLWAQLSIVPISVLEQETELLMIHFRNLADVSLLHCKIFLPREGRNPRGLHVAFFRGMTPELQVNAVGAFFSRKNFWRENSNELKCIVSA